MKRLRLIPPVHVYQTSVRLLGGETPTHIVKSLSTTVLNDNYHHYNTFLIRSGPVLTAGAVAARTQRRPPASQ